MTQTALMPSTFYGKVTDSLPWTEMDWVRDLPGDVYCALWLQNPSGTNFDLPLGHDLYVISFNMEQVDIDWLRYQYQRISAPVIVLDDANFYDFQKPENFHFYTFYGWQRQVELIMSWFPNRALPKPTKKASVICNRITQSKLLIFTALLEILGPDQCIVKLGDWLEEKNVLYRQPTGNSTLDRLSDIFYSKYFGNLYTVDEFDNTQNFQAVNSNPWSSFYTDAAIHFTNESYHYSYMQDANGAMIHPGPNITEKTWKTIICGTPFIPVGQFDTIGTLQRLGFEFNYGLDFSWDQDPGNLTRLESIVFLIKQLDNYSVGDLVSMTRDSTRYNLELVLSGEFQKKCRNHNEKIVSEIFSKFGR